MLLSKRTVVPVCVAFVSIHLVALYFLSLVPGRSTGRRQPVGFFRSRNGTEKTFAITELRFEEQVARMEELSEAHGLKYGNLSAFNLLYNAHFKRFGSGGAKLALEFESETMSAVSLNGTKPYAGSDLGAVIAVTEAVGLGNNVFLQANQGFVYNDGNAARYLNYSLVRAKEMDKYRHEQLAWWPQHCEQRGAARVPWLVEFKNVWMDGFGNVYAPSRERNRMTWAVKAYSFQGGCCHLNWKNAKKDLVKLRRGRGCTKRYRVGFSVTQNHGSTYWHVMRELIPRLFSFWRVAVTVASARDGVIAIPYGGLTAKLIRLLGVPEERVTQIDFNEACFFEQLLVPEPTIQGGYATSCMHSVIARVLREHVQGARARPFILLVERALKRSADGSRCVGKRCLANFAELQDAITREFGMLVEVRVLSPSGDDLFRRSVELFSRASVVVGMHGAGITNQIFMQRGAHVIHLGWHGMWQLYARVAKEHGIDFVNVITEGASQTGENAKAEIPVVILEIRRALEKDEVLLAPPVIKTNATRNAQVVLRLP